MNQPKKFFIYARKSTDDKDRQIRSIPDQLSELEELAKKENIAIVDIFIEKETAKVPGRPVFARIIERIEQGDAQGILAWHPDRLARNSIDGGKIIYLVDTGKLCELRFPTFWFENTPQGKFMLSIAFSQSKYYVDNLSENIKRGQRNKLKNGIWPKNAPIGYLNDPITKTLVVDEKRSVFIKQIFEAYATGDYTLKRLRDSFNSIGFSGKREKALAISNYHHILKNPFYYGVMRYNGEIHEAKHPPIISKKIFEDVQSVLSRKSKPKSRILKPFLYRGIFRCGSCDCYITTETQKGHNYLHCTKRVKPCAEKYVREENISAQVVSFLEQYTLPEYAAQWMLKEIENERSAKKETYEHFARQTELQIKEIETKLEKLTFSYLENIFSLEEYQKTKETLLSQKLDLKEKMESAERNALSRFEPIQKFLEANISNAKTLIDGKSDKILSVFKKVGSNPKIQNMEFHATPRKAWQTLAGAGFGGESGLVSALRADPDLLVSSNLDFMRRR